MYNLSRRTFIKRTLISIAIISSGALTTKLITTNAANINNKFQISISSDPKIHQYPLKKHLIQTRAFISNKQSNLLSQNSIPYDNNQLIGINYTNNKKAKFNIYVHKDKIYKYTLLPENDISPEYKTHTYKTALLYIGSHNGISIDTPNNINDATLITYNTDTNIPLIPTYMSPELSIYPRSTWGCHESKVSYQDNKKYNTNSTIAHSIVLHHSAISLKDNNYTEKDIPGIINGIYLNGFPDYGDMKYNFLIDIYGRVWEGRRGSMIAGPDNKEIPTIQSAATAGFNVGTISICFLGNFMQGKDSITNEMIASSMHLIKYLSQKYKFSLKDKTKLISSGAPIAGANTNKYQKGVSVTLPALFKHKDVNNTDCPGTIDSDAILSKLINT